MERLYYTICILTILICSEGYTQMLSDKPLFLTAVVDSIQFSVWDVGKKEMMTEAEFQKKGEYEQELKRTTIHGSDQDSFLTLLQLDIAYSNSRSLQGHYNLVFELFKGRVIIGKITVSTFTGNINISVDPKKEGSDFYSNCSNVLGNYLIGLLTKYQYMPFLDRELDLEGLGILMIDE